MNNSFGKKKNHGYNWGTDMIKGVGTKKTVEKQHIEVRSHVPWKSSNG